jgi:ubiquinone/menaquinone biosynthesis C-methylase UbiE
MNGLNVSSGEHYCPDWINFDLLPQARLDLRADLFHLPFPDATFTKVYAGHTLEHLAWDHIPQALTEIRRVMVAGAELMVVGPDIERALLTNQPQWLLNAIVIDGPHSGPGGHKWTATGLLTLLAVRTVFPQAAEVPVAAADKPAWPNPTTIGWQCAVHAHG